MSREEKTTHKRVETARVFILVLSGRMVIPNCFVELWALLLYQKHRYQLNYSLLIETTTIEWCPRFLGLGQGTFFVLYVFSDKGSSFALCL